jgi:hypothetical protein
MSGQKGTGTEMYPPNSGDLARERQRDLMREAEMERLAAEVTAEPANVPGQQTWPVRLASGVLGAVLGRSAQRREARVARKVAQPAGALPTGSRTARP